MSREPFVLLHRSILDRGLRRLIAFVEAVAFWTAVALPALYVFGYLAAVLHPDLALPPASVIGAVLGVNVLAVVVGQYHGDGADGQATDSSPSPSGE